MVEMSVPEQGSEDMANNRSLEAVVAAGHGGDATVTRGGQSATCSISTIRPALQANLACVVPMYNEAGHVSRFLRELCEKVSPRFRCVTIIAVDDGSRDATAREVRAAISEGLPVRLVRLSRNFGKEVALTAGLAITERLESRADVVLMIDADFQHPFSAVEQMIQRWESGVDMVYGVQSRTVAREPGAWLCCGQDAAAGPGVQHLGHTPFCERGPRHPATPKPLCGKGV